MNLPKIAAALLLATTVLPAAAHAEAPARPQITQGATVYDPQGGVVGTIEKVSGNTVVVNTGTNSATLDAGVFGSSDKGLSISFTQAQLNQAIEAANQASQDKLAAALVVGAPVRSKDNVPVGAVKTINADGSVVVEREAGPFTLTRQNFATDANGLIIRLTARQIDDAIAQATGENAPATASSDAASSGVTASADSAAPQPEASEAAGAEARPAE